MFHCIFIAKFVANIQQGTLSEEQKMAKCISVHILVPNSGFCGNYTSNNFCNMRNFENGGISHRFFPFLAGKYPVT